MEGYGSALPTIDGGGHDGSPMDGYGNALPTSDIYLSLPQDNETLSTPEKESKGEQKTLTARQLLQHPGALRKSKSNSNNSPSSRRAMTESSPMIQLSPRRKDAGPSIGKPRKMSIGQFDTPGKSPKTRSRPSNRQFLSLTRDQIEKANALASNLRSRDVSLQDIDSSLEMEGLSLAEKLLLLRNRTGPAPAADLMQRLLTELAEKGGSKEEISEMVEAGITAELRSVAEASALGGQRQWNEEFQTLLEMQDGVDKFALLRALYSDFCYAAQSYGSIIISERHLPMEMKTIRPSTSLGGVAGGEKYVCQNIL